MQISEARNFLGQYLFTGDDVFRPISTLSGGERGRVALAKLALSGANFLLLDEPTNHLDIDSQEVMQAVLDDFAGTVLLVSHDRYLIDALATQIWAASPGSSTCSRAHTANFWPRARRPGCKRPNGQRRRPTARNRTQARSPAEKKHGLSARELEQRIVEAEAAIAELEARLAELGADLERASMDGDAARVRELGEDYAQTETDLAAAMAEWEHLAG